MTAVRARPAPSDFQKRRGSDSRTTSTGTENAANPANWGATSWILSEYPSSGRSTPRIVPPMPNESEELERPDLADQADDRKGRDVRKTRVVVERGHSGGPDVEPVLVWEPVGDELQARQVLVCIDALRKSGPGAQEEAEDEHDDRDARGRRDLASPSGHPAIRPRR